MGRDEANDTPIVESLGHVAVDDAQREPFDNGGFAYAGLADEHRVILGSAGEDLNHPADFVVTTNDWIESSFGREIGQIAPYFSSA